MSEKEPLVIIDMQPNYPISEKIISKVIRHIRKAIKNHAPIVVVEYDIAKTPTWPIITNILAGYPNYIIIKKYSWDGSVEIRDILKAQWGIKSKILGQKQWVKICGVYTNHCVAATVDGLIRKKFGVIVLEDACMAISPDEQNKQICTWRTLKSVQIQ